MRIILLPLLSIVIAANANAQAPAGYYNSAFGLNGSALQTALHNKIASHTELTYTPGLWNAYYSTDVKPNSNKIWTLYSDKPGQASPYEFVAGTNQCSGNSPNSEGSCYNREHLWPRTYFGGQVPPMNSDLWIVYPTDYWVNSKRADLPYGKVGGSATFTSQNGSKVGINTYAGMSGQCFEPIDSFKGDVARTYFYVATRYLGQDAGWSDWSMANKAVLKPATVTMLLEWHHNDPVSQKEILRNNAVQTQQNNRNPFIDFPEFADCIWGTGDCSKLSVPSVAGGNLKIRIHPNPAVNNVQIDWEMLNPEEVLAVDVVTIQGQVIFHKNTEQQKHLELPTADWPRGMYLIKVETRQGLRAEKLILQ